MIRTLTIIIASMALTGCAAPAAVIYSGSQTETRAHTSRIMAQLRPDLDQTASGACIYDNMTRREVLTMGTSDITGISQKHLDTVNTVIARPKTQACLAAVPAASA